MKALQRKQSDELFHCAACALWMSVTQSMKFEVNRKKFNGPRFNTRVPVA